jgi:hypothetical protein
MLMLMQSHRKRMAQTRDPGKDNKPCNYPHPKIIEVLSLVCFLEKNHLQCTNDFGKYFPSSHSRINNRDVSLLLAVIAVLTFCNDA